MTPRQANIQREIAALHRRLAELHEESAADVPEERERPADKRERQPRPIRALPDINVTEADEAKAVRALRKKGFRVV